MKGSAYISRVYLEIGQLEPRAPIFSIVVFCMNRSRSWTAPVREVTEALLGWDFLVEYPLDPIADSTISSILHTALG